MENLQVICCIFMQMSYFLYTNNTVINFGFPSMKILVLTIDFVIFLEEIGNFNEINRKRPTLCFLYA